MREIADGVHQIALFPRCAVNAYLVGEVLVDAGLKGSVPKILRDLDAASAVVTSHVITHAHGDHAGGSADIAEKLGIPVRTGEADRATAESGEPPLSATVDRPGIRGVARMFGSFDGVSVDGTLAEGDEIAPGFVVLETPGHSSGHIVLWRESDGVLVCGDVVTNMHLATTRPGLHEPPRAFTPDPQRNRASIRRIADLGPRVLCPGHGPVLTDAAEPLRAFAASL